MSNYTAKGKLIAKTKVENIESKGKTYPKCSFTIEQETENSGKVYKNYMKFSLFGDKKVGLIDGFKQHEEIEVHFNLNGKKYEKDGKVDYFMDMGAWKIEKSVAAASEGDGFGGSGSDDTDLPF